MDPSLAEEVEPDDPEVDALAAQVAVETAAHQHGFPLFRVTFHTLSVSHSQKLRRPPVLTPRNYLVSLSQSPTLKRLYKDGMRGVDYQQSCRNQSVVKVLGDCCPAPRALLPRSARSRQRAAHDGRSVVRARGQQWLSAATEGSDAPGRN